MNARTPIVITIIAAILVSGVLLGLQFGSQSPPSAGPKHGHTFLNGTVQVDEEFFLTSVVFLSPIVVNPETRKPERLIVANVNWRVRMDLLGESSVYRAFEPSSREPVIVTASFDALAADPKPQHMPTAGLYAVLIEPVPGLTWGLVREDADLIFDAQLVETRTETPR